MNSFIFWNFIPDIDPVFKNLNAEKKAGLYHERYILMAFWMLPCGNVINFETVKYSANETSVPGANRLLGFKHVKQGSSIILPNMPR